MCVITLSLLLFHSDNSMCGLANRFGAALKVCVGSSLTLPLSYITAYWLIPDIFLVWNRM